jgi:hypothetical protein
VPNFVSVMTSVAWIDLKLVLHAALSAGNSVHRDRNVTYERYQVVKETSMQK